MTQRNLLKLKSLIICVAFVISGCGKQLSNAEDRAMVIDSVNTFTLDFYHKLAKFQQTEENGNIICSPLSVSAVLSMVYAGAHGKTADEIEKALYSETLKERAHPAFHDILKKMTDGSDYELYLANQVWVPNGTNLNERYIDINRRYYGSSPREIDFAGGKAGNVVADWIRKETHGRIKNTSIPEINEQTNLLLTSVIYFKGTWVNQFDPEKTEEDRRRRS